MSGLRGYLFSIVTAAVICALVGALGKDSAAGPLVRLLCGIFLAVTVLRPLAHLDLERWMDIAVPYRQDAQFYSEQGEEFSRRAKAELIKQNVQAYILDKAKELHAPITVQVVLQETGEPLPQTVILTGRVSPYAKAQLQRMMEEDLGIAKEQQQWTS